MCSALEGHLQHVFSWTIENFRACTIKNGRYLESRTFEAGSLEETTWFVRLYPRGTTETSEDVISIFLNRSFDCTGPVEMECVYTIEAMDGNNELLEKKHYESKFKAGGALGWKEFLLRERLDESTLSNQALNIRVTLKKRLPKIFTENGFRTKITTDDFTFKWNVKNLTDSCAERKTVSISKDLQFEISIEILVEDVKIIFRRIKGFRNSEILVCSVTLLDSKGDETDSKESVFEADDKDQTDSWEFPTFLKKSEIYAFRDHKKNYFTLKFDFALSVGKTSESMKSTECLFFDDFLKTEKDLSVSLKTDLKRVFTENVHTDVDLHVGGQVIRAHKVILCARSPVFLAMFNQDMVENQTGAINISDVEPETMKSLLNFMYTDDTEDKDYKETSNLLLAADKYQVLSLKERCSSSLESFLTDENVCHILFTADLIQQKSLKARAVSYIQKHPKKIFKSDEWKELFEKNLKLATEVFCTVSTS